MKRTLIASAIAAGLAIGMSENLQAQALEEIIVTARQREESVQDIPVAVSAFTESDFEKRGILGLADVAQYTAGLNFEDFGGGFGTPVIRSTSQTRLTALEPNVSTFFDGIYVPAAWAINSGVTNLSRVEVVKGPQSARYGRNAFMGAINYIPKGPTDEFEAEITAGYGSDERQDYGFRVAGPIIEGTLKGSFSLNDSEFDGSQENRHPLAGIDLGQRGTQDNAGGWNNRSYSAALEFTPTDSLTMDLGFYNFDLSDESRGAGQLAEFAGDTNCGNTNIFGGPRLFCGTIPSPPDVVAVDPRAYGRQAEIDILRFGVDYEINDSLSLSYLFGNIEGDVDIASISERSQIECGTSIPGSCQFQNTPLGGIDYDTHELRLSSDSGGNLTWTVGTFFSDGEDQTGFAIPGVPPLTSTPLVQQPQIRDVGTDIDVTAIFGEFSYRFSDKWLFSAEGRYSDEEKVQTNNATGQVFSGDFKNFTPRLSLEYQLDDDRLLYGSLAKGVKSGGFNPTAAQEAERVFDEEQNWTFEIGSKNTLMDGSLVLNAALFYIQWEDIQLNAADSGANNPNAVNITLNLGDATTYGVELDALAYINDNFQLNAAISLTDATYDDGTIDNRFARVGPAFFPNTTSCDDILCPSNGDISGNDVERQAPVQISVGGEWNNDIEAWNASYFVRADVSYQSEQEAESMNLAQLESRTILNTTLGLQFDNWDVSLWARNLTDERYTSNSFTVLLPFGNGYGYIFGERRTWGLSASYRF
ncbi:MAG: TonB-dependent receptor [Lysobacterales bacterium]